MTTSTTQASRRLEGRVAIVTGASRGIGAAVARAFSHAGAAVVLAARDHDALARLAGELSEAGGTVLAGPTPRPPPPPPAPPLRPAGGPPPGRPPPPHKTPARGGPPPPPPPRG